MYKVRVTFEPLTDNVGDLTKPRFTDCKCFGSGESDCCDGEYLMHDGKPGAAVLQGNLEPRS